MLRSDSSSRGVRGVPTGKAFPALAGGGGPRWPQLYTSCGGNWTPVRAGSHRLSPCSCPALSSGSGAAARLL